MDTSRLASTGMLVGAGSVLFLLATHMSAVRGERTLLVEKPVLIDRPTPVLIDRSVIVERPFVIDRPIVMTPESPPVLGCPVLPATRGAPNGTPVDVYSFDMGERDERTEGTLQVVAAAASPRIAVRDGVTVRMTDDDGASFSSIFVGTEVDEIAIDRDGVVFARAGEQFGVRTTDGVERWREMKLAPCEYCADRLAAVGASVVWIHDGTPLVSADLGRTWTTVATADQAWASGDNGALRAWDGSLYLVQHYWDQCGVDDYPVFRLNLTTRTITHSTFHNYYDDSQPLADLAADNDVAPTWTWTARCWRSEDDTSRACKASRRESPLLAMKTLAPAEGARTLAVYDRSLVELCRDGARQVYRSFPFDHVDATDWLGRPVVASGNTVLRWSPIHGWRRLSWPAP